MLLAKTLSFYKKPLVQKKLLEHSKDKEVAIQFKDYYSKRPNTLQYESDILEFAKSKATSFHSSEERWSNPMSLRSGMSKKEQDELRIGWDLILDIDCKHFIYSKIATHLLIKILKDQGIKNVTCKFSGNKGFHIAVPFEAFPETINSKPTKDLFPEAPRKIAYYLRDKLQPLLEKAILKIEKNSLENVSKRTMIPVSDLIKKDMDNKIKVRDSLDTDAFLEIDTVLIASRHLYRMPYSFHEKSGLVSVPVNVNNILKFKKDQAKPENVDFEIPFLTREADGKEALTLILNAYDFYPEKKSDFEKKEFKLPEQAIPEEFFPPTINNILKGLVDGKKRALFTLINFLKGCGWTYEAIRQRIYAWNKKNPEPLREVYLKGQLNQIKKQKDVFPPHNYPTAGDSYYKDLGIWTPDELEKKMKNPLQYAKFKFEQSQEKKKGRPKLTEEQKEMRRKYREKLKKQQKEE